MYYLLFGFCTDGKVKTCLPQSPSLPQPCPAGWGTWFTLSPTWLPSVAPKLQPWKACVAFKPPPNSLPSLQGHFRPVKRARGLRLWPGSANRHLREHGGAHSQCFDKKSGKTALRPGISTNERARLGKGWLWLVAQIGGHSFHRWQINTDEWRWAANVFKKVQPALLRCTLKKLLRCTMVPRTCTFEMQLAILRCTLKTTIEMYHGIKNLQPALLRCNTEMQYWAWTIEMEQLTGKGTELLPSRVSEREKWAPVSVLVPSKHRLF